MTIDERLEKLVERHEALRESVELLAGSTSDLRAVIEAETQRGRERDQLDRDRLARDREYLKLIADVLKHWANGQENQ